LSHHNGNAFFIVMVAYLLSTGSSSLNVANSGVIQKQLQMTLVQKFNAFSFRSMLKLLKIALNSAFANGKHNVRKFFCWKN